MYQLFIALENKKKSNLSATAMETMRPAAPAKLAVAQSKLYQEVSSNKILFKFINNILNLY